MTDVEERCPKQCESFKKIIEEMYQVHLEKNHDYSPRSILSVGEVGLATRVWDKVTRLLNLTGFNIETGEYTKPKSPKNESINDTLLDLANYAIIWKILREGNWGK